MLEIGIGSEEEISLRIWAQFLSEKIVVKRFIFYDNTIFSYLTLRDYTEHIYMKTRLQLTQPRKKNINKTIHTKKSDVTVQTPSQWLYAKIS